MAAAAVAVTVAATVYGAMQIRRSGTDSPRDAGPTTSQPRATTSQPDISSRANDPKPLTDAEVFPLNRISGSAGAAYRILAKEANTNCTQAATGEVAALLSAYGCSQVVRGTMRSSDGTFLITAGIFNLVDATAATGFFGSAASKVDNGTGSFTGLLAGAGTEALRNAGRAVGWFVPIGHYLAYYVIVRADGQASGPDADATHERIRVDIGTCFNGIALARVEPGHAGLPSSTLPSASMR